MQSEPRDVSPHESGTADPLRPTSLLVRAADSKRVFRAEGPVNPCVEGPVKPCVENTVMREMAR